MADETPQPPSWDNSYTKEQKNGKTLLKTTDEKGKTYEVQVSDQPPISEENEKSSSEEEEEEGEEEEEDPPKKPDKETKAQFRDADNEPKAPLTKDEADIKKLTELKDIILEKNPCLQNKADSYAAEQRKENINNGMSQEEADNRYQVDYKNALSQIKGALIMEYDKVLTQTSPEVQAQIQQTFAEELKQQYPPFSGAIYRPEQMTEALKNAKGPNGRGCSEGSAQLGEALTGNNIFDHIDKDGGEYKVLKYGNKKIFPDQGDTIVDQDGSVIPNKEVLEWQSGGLKYGMGKDGKFHQWPIGTGEIKAIENSGQYYLVPNTFSPEVGDKRLVFYQDGLNGGWYHSQTYTPLGWASDKKDSGTYDVDDDRVNYMLTYRLRR